jgi:hypothetical protein
MCAVRHPDKLQELDSTHSGIARAPAVRHARTPHLPAEGRNGNGKHRMGVGHEKRAALWVEEKRQYPRLPLDFPLKVKRIAGQPAETGHNGNGAAGGAWHTLDISSCGVRFAAPLTLEVGIPVELEIEIVSGPLGGRHLQMVTQARVVRAWPAQGNGRAPKAGWQEYAAEFEEITFHRDDSPADSNVPARGNNGKSSARPVA